MPSPRGVRSRPGRSLLVTVHRAPTARPRRSGRTALYPGHQSARWYGSERSAQISSCAATNRLVDRRRMLALSRHAREELLSAEHSFELLAAFFLAQDVDLRVCRVAGDLLDAEMAVG